MELNTNKIEKVRKYKGFTQIEFSEKIGVSPSTYKNQLKSKDFRIEQLIKISQVLGISIDNLFRVSDINDHLDNLVAEEEQIMFKDKYNELKKHVKVLEDRLKDKDEIINLLKKELNK